MLLQLLPLIPNEQLDDIVSSIPCMTSRQNFRARFSQARGDNLVAKAAPSELAHLQYRREVPPQQTTLEQNRRGCGVQHETWPIKPANSPTQRPSTQDHASTTWLQSAMSYPFCPQNAQYSSRSSVASSGSGSTPELRGINIIQGQQVHTRDIPRRHEVSGHTTSPSVSATNMWETSPTSDITFKAEPDHDSVMNCFAASTDHDQWTIRPWNGGLNEFVTRTQYC